MASISPSKSQLPLHEFNSTSFKWSKEGKSSGHPQRRRSVNPPVRRRDPSSLSPLRHSPMPELASATSQHLESPLRDSVLPSLVEPQDISRKLSPVGARLPCKPSPERQMANHSPMGGDAVEKSPVGCGDSAKQFPTLEFASGSETLERNEGFLIEYKRNRSRNSAFESVKHKDISSSSEQTVQKSEKRQKVTEVDEAGIKKSKILIKIPCKNESEEGIITEGPRKIEINGKGDENDGVKGEGKTDTNVNEVTRIRNLRPRKPVDKSINANAAGAKTSTSLMSDKNKYQKPLGSEANRSMKTEGNKNGGVKKVKRKLSISIPLSKAEIEEDIFSMTGSKPRRKPKKRPRNIQKQLDFVFPGMWLVSITPDLYKVSVNDRKG